MTQHGMKIAIYSPNKKFFYKEMRKGFFCFECNFTNRYLQFVPKNVICYVITNVKGGGIK